MSKRRDFIKQVGATAAFGLTGFPPSGGAVGPGPLRRDPGDFIGRGDRLRERVTLFFNLSHLRGADTTHYLYMAGRKYALTRVADAPAVLQNERRRNAFLSAVPDEFVTHHVVGVAVPGDAIALAYLTCNEDPASGSWEMTSMHFNIPTSTAASVYARARMLTATGPLPLSGKRRMYGLPPAMTEVDLAEESVLVDTTSHAEALVGLHPDILSIESHSGAHIQANYVSQDSNTFFLGLTLRGMGPAVPQGTTNVAGTQPWATLLPLVDDATGKPYKKSDGKLDQYYPDWNPDVDTAMASAVGTVHPLVANDATLGIDVTPYNLNDPANPVPPSALTGTKWARHDGIPTVFLTPSAISSTDPKVVFTNRGAETGLYVSQPDIQVLGDKRVQVTLDNVSNWFLRYLGMWVQFIDPDKNVIPVNQLPHDTFPSGPGPYPRAGSLDKDDALFLGVVSPAVAVLGIPVYPGQFAPTLNIPLTAQTLRAHYAGAGLTGSAPSDPAGITGVGIGMTVAFNYGVVGLFMAAGASTYDSVFKKVVSIGGGTVATAVTSLIGGLINGSDFGKGLLSFAMGFIKVMWGAGGSMALAEIAALISLELGAAEVIDSIPIAGQCARAVAAVVGALQLAESSIEIGISPPVYTFDVVQTHNLSINILPDPRATQFPAPPAGYTLYYRVSYLFDNGTAHTRPEVTVSDPTVKSIAIMFAAIPRGGMVNISIGFYMRKSTTPSGQNDWCAGFATTGLIDNTVDTAPDTAITEAKNPILSSTQYVHTRKSTLDAQGNHLWTTTPVAPPFLPPPDGQQPGLGGLNGITVRQGTSNPPQQGYVGYAWKAYSSGLNGCAGPAPGQFDQMANLNTDAGNGGANAQNGYANTAKLCGFNPGVRIGYDLLTHNALNVYLDTDKLMVRQVDLDPPTFAGTASNQSFGMLNLDSTRCLLHPSGHIVSISQAFHKMEVLKLPAAPVSDAEAAQHYLARSLSGSGVRPGLIQSPAALAIAPDGVILVLEQANNRIQAFDLGGNPAPYFTGQPVPYYLELDATAGNTYLDLAVEFTGYLYVLSTDDSGNHRLDIYHPSQTGTAPICSTQGVNAAKLTVDFWRAAYTLNYEVLKIPGGGIPPFTEPSVSLWLPTPPSQ